MIRTYCGSHIYAIKKVAIKVVSIELGRKFYFSKVNKVLLKKYKQIIFVTFFSKKIAVKEALKSEDNTAN
jgi:hypothetical protein